MTLNRVFRIGGLLLSAALLSACSQNSVVKDEPAPVQNEDPGYQLVMNERFSEVAAANTAVDKDRAAIRAMQGEYKVNFDFKETVVLQSDYERYPPKQAGAFETVLVIEESPTHFVMQHILVVGGGKVVKHWRQDWTYEANERFEFVANQTWEVKALPEKKAAGTWTQCVYEVSDAPRYCGTGKWNHKYGVSTWTSDRTWRPLPRREYTVRSDYNALNVENRHTVTPQGWTHEQDNTKTVRNGKQTEKTLVREYGFNDYRRVDGYDFSPAYNYWEKTSNYWHQVRGAWSERFAKNKSVVLNTEVDGMPIIEATFGHAESIENGTESPTRDDVDEVLNKWVTGIFDLQGAKL